MSVLMKAMPHTITDNDGSDNGQMDYAPMSNIQTIKDFTGFRCSIKFWIGIKYKQIFLDTEVMHYAWHISVVSIDLHKSFIKLTLQICRTHTMLPKEQRRMCLD